MYQYDDPTTVATLPPPQAAGTPGYFIDGNPSVGTAATILRSDFMNMLQAEMLNILAAGDITPSKTTYNQVLLAIQTFVQSGVAQYAVDTGAVNALAAAFSPVISTLVDGMRLKVKAKYTNTTAVTFDAGTGANPVVGLALEALQAGEIHAAGVCDFQWNTALSSWVLIECTGGALQVALATQPNQAARLSQVQTALIQGIFKNLAASATGTNANVAVTCDEIALESASDVYYVARAVSLTIAGTTSGAANGLDTGAIAASTWYSVWVIGNGTTVAGLLSLSATSPTLPTGYTYKARVGWILTDATANKYPISFKQFGRDVQWVTASGSNLTALPVVISGTQGSTTTPTFVAGSVTASCPTTAGKIRLAHMMATSSSSSVQMLAPNGTYGAYGTSSAAPSVILQASTSGSFVQFVEFLLESSNIYFASNNSGARVVTLGWTDNI